MKFILATTLAVLAMLFLPGCCEIAETPMPPTYDAKDCFKGKQVKIEGLDFSYTGAVGTSIAQGQAYNWKTNSNVTATAVVTQYAQCSTMAANEYAGQYLENMGFNVKGNAPHYIISGKMGNGETDWSHAIYMDGPINCTLGLFGIMISIRQKNWSALRIYKLDGTFIKEYRDEESYNIVTLGLPYSAFFMEKTQDTSARFAAGCYSMKVNLNHFLDDYAAGTFEKQL